MNIEDVKKGWCVIDGKKAIIRKITVRPDGNTVVCFHFLSYGGGICEKFEVFRERRLEYPPQQYFGIA